MRGGYLSAPFFFIFGAKAAIFLKELPFLRASEAKCLAFMQNPNPRNILFYRYLRRGNCALGCCFVDKTKKTLIKLFNKHFYPGDKIFRQ